MGWSEQYWEDVKGEMEQLGRERRASPQDDTRDESLDGATADAAVAPEPAEV